MAGVFHWLYDAVKLWSDRGVMASWQRRVVSPSAGLTIEIGAGSGLGFRDHHAVAIAAARARARAGSVDEARVPAALDDTTLATARRRLPLNRDTRRLMANAGFVIDEIRDHAGGLFVELAGRVPTERRG